MLEIETFLALIPILFGVWASYRTTGVFLFYFFLLAVMWPEGIVLKLGGTDVGYARIFPLTVLVLFAIQLLRRPLPIPSGRELLYKCLVYSGFVVLTFLVPSFFNLIFFGYFPKVFLTSSIFSLWIIFPILVSIYTKGEALFKENLVSQTAWVAGVVFLLVSPQSIAFYFENFDSLWRVRQGSELVVHLSYLIVFYFNELAVFFFTLGEESSMLFSIFSASALYFILNALYRNKIWPWFALAFVIFVITINQYLKMAACFYIQVALFPVVYILQNRIRYGHFGHLQIRKTVILFMTGLILLPTVLETREQRLGIHESRGTVASVVSYLMTRFELSEYTDEDGRFYIFAQKLRNRSGRFDHEGNHGGNRLSRIQITWDKFLETPLLGRGIAAPANPQRQEYTDPFLSGVSYLVDHLYLFGIFGGLVSYLFVLVGPFYFMRRKFYQIFSMKESYFLITFWVVAFLMSVLGFIPRNASSKSLIHFFNIWIICRYQILNIQKSGFRYS